MYIDKENPRHAEYARNLKIYNGKHYEIFNINEQTSKTKSWEYLCFDIAKMALTTKADLIWLNAPLIEFNKVKLQKEWDILRENTYFDELMREATIYSMVFGDQLLKVSIDQNNLTADEDDLELCLYLQTPMNWVPLYDTVNPQKSAKTDEIIHKKKFDDVDTYLVEYYSPGQVKYRAFVNNGEIEQIPLLRYWREELNGVLSDVDVDETSLEAIHYTGTRYSLLQRIKNDFSIESYYGMSDITLPVISKLNALNNYANLADIIIVTNTFPKLILSEKAGNIIKRIIDEIERGKIDDTENLHPGLTDVSLTSSPVDDYMTRQTYLQTYIYRKLTDEMRAFQDDGRGETKYLKNDFSLDEMRKQHDIFFKSIMTELGISEVFYNSSLRAGATTGEALKRLMYLTLNEAQIMRNKLEPIIKRVVFTMLELAKENGLITSKPEMPLVQFQAGISESETEKLEMLVTKVQNNFIPLIEAIKIVNNVDEEKALEILDKMNIMIQSTKVKQTQNNVERIPGAVSTPPSKETRAANAVVS